MHLTIGFDKVACSVLVLCGIKDNVFKKKATVKYVEKLVNVIFSILKSGCGVKCLQSRLSHIIRRKMFFAHNAQV